MSLHDPDVKFSHLSSLNTTQCQRVMSELVSHLCTNDAHCTLVLVVNNTKGKGQSASIRHRKMLHLTSSVITKATIISILLLEINRRMPIADKPLKAIKRIHAYISNKLTRYILRYIYNYILYLYKYSDCAIIFNKFQENK